MPTYKHKTKKKIAYPDAPSGYINIEKWEPPFTPVPRGFGYIGIVAEDSKTGELQCHICGKWYQMLCSHYSAKHNLTGAEYRKKFELLNSTALKSKRIRLLQSDVISKMQKEGKMNIGNKKNKNGKRYGFTKGNKEAGNRLGTKRAKEQQNKYGNCDLQIMTKIIELGKKLNKTPTLTDIKKEYGGGIITIMHLRYGSYIKYCRNYLKMTPNFSTHNPKFTTNKAWKDHLLSIGRQQLKDGKKLNNINKFFPTTKEPRYIYKYFKNWKDYKAKLLA
jgi:hypothetical protein